MRYRSQVDCHANRRSLCTFWGNLKSKPHCRTFKAKRFCATVYISSRFQVMLMPSKSVVYLVRKFQTQHKFYYALKVRGVESACGNSWTCSLNIVHFGVIEIRSVRTVSMRVGKWRCFQCKYVYFGCTSQNHFGKMCVLSILVNVCIS